MRPQVICHMLLSRDGKATGNFLFGSECESSVETYYRINRELRGDAYACGRVTMDSSFVHGAVPELEKYDGVTVPCGDYIADKECNLYAVSFDRRGRLGWQSAYIEDADPGYGGAHVVEILCEDLVDKRYLAYLREVGISYIFAGGNDTDIPLVLEKLGRYFGITCLLLEGGSIINRAFYDADAIDSLSLVVAPVTGDAGSYPLFFGINIDDGCYPGFLKVDEKSIDNSIIQNYIREDKERIV